MELNENQASWPTLLRTRALMWTGRRCGWPRSPRRGDPVRLQLIDVLRKHAGKVCVCELVPLFDLSQPTVSHSAKAHRRAGRLRTPRALGLYHYVIQTRSARARRLVDLTQRRNRTTSPKETSA